jgi:hypothetical protein
LPVLLLGAEALRRDNEDAILRHAAAGELGEANRDVVRQRRRAAHVEAELHGARHLVDVLPARPGGAHEALLDLALVERDGLGDPDHGAGRTAPSDGLILTTASRSAAIM